MKTKMKMKNNRMLLALVMVAALAMVSVAGVAVIADDSDAVENTFVTPTKPVAIGADFPGNSVYNIFSTDAKVGTLVANFTGTGTINFGSYDSNNKFVPTMTMKFTDSTGFSIFVKTDSAGAFESATIFNTVADSATAPVTTGTIQVVLGNVTFGGNLTIPGGVAANYSFDGKVTAGAATITSVGVAGTIVSVDATGNASMSGTLAANASKTAPSSTVPYSCILTVDGQMNIGAALTVGQNINLVFNGDVKVPAVAKGATKAIAMTGTGALITINGNFEMGQTVKADDVPATINATSGTVQVNGSLTGLATQILGEETINAAKYFNATTGITTYTTLANAMKASSAITITGELFITEDTVLTGISTANPAVNTITFGASATLTIGSAGKTPMVDVPATTTLTAAAADNIIILGGQLRLVTATVYTEANVVSAVGMSDSKYASIYTDLATALGMAVSGNTVTLRGTADVSTTTEVKAGVILDAKDKIININAGGKLTINGELKGTSVIKVSGPTAAGVIPALAAGVLELNNNKIACTSITVTGVLNIGAADLKQALTAETGAVINITGKLTAAITGAAAATEFTVNVSGSFIGNIVTSTVATMNVSGVFTLAVATTVKDVSVTGKVIGTDTLILTVSGTMTVGTPSNTLGPSVNNATVKGVTLAATGKAIVYGTAADVKITYASSTTPASDAKTVFYFGDAVYATEYGGATTIAVMIPTVKLKDFNFLGWYDAPVGGIAVTENSGKTLGELKSVYGYTAPMQYSLTLTYNQGASWILNGTVQSGVVSLTAGTYDLSVLVNDGYKGDAKITVTGDATYSNGKLTVTGDAAVSVSGVSVKDGGLDITEILLIVLVVIIALLAIIVVFKMLRS